MESPACPRCGGAVPLSEPGVTAPLCDHCQQGEGGEVRTPLAVRLAEISSGLAAGLGDLPLSTEFARSYTIDRVLACGGMGVVFLAEHRALSRPVALKFLCVDSEEMRARFRREATVLASLSHPNVMRLLDHGEEAGMPFHAVEFLPGGTLAERITRKLKLDLADAVAITHDMLSGLAACHARGIVHRDLKPENVLFGDDGCARLADLGIAHDAGAVGVLTQTGMLLGTPRYMSPEQARGELVTHSADLYAVGAMLYHMLSGQPPFTAGDPVQLLRKHILEAPPPLDELVHALPRGLAALVHRALAKTPAERPESADAFALELARVAGPRSTPGRPAEEPPSGDWPAPPPRKAPTGPTVKPRGAHASPRRMRRIALLAGTVALAPLVVALVVVGLRPRAEPVVAPTSAPPTPSAAPFSNEAMLKAEAAALEARIEKNHREALRDPSDKGRQGTLREERRALIRHFLARMRAVLGPRSGALLPPVLAVRVAEDVHERAQELKIGIEDRVLERLMAGRGTVGALSGDWYRRQTEAFELVTRDVRDLSPAVFGPRTTTELEARFMLAACMPLRQSFEILDASIYGRYEDELKRWVVEYPRSWVSWHVEAERRNAAKDLEGELDARAASQARIERLLDDRPGAAAHEGFQTCWMEAIARQQHVCYKLKDPLRAAEVEGRLGRARAFPLPPHLKKYLEAQIGFLHSTIKGNSTEMPAEPGKR